MKFLVEKDMTQSQSIRLGIELEHLLNDYICKETSFLRLERMVHLERIGKKKIKQCDHIFHDVENNIIHYAELKCNLDLDSEKSVSTYIKCQQITDELRHIYPHCDVRMYLVSLIHHNKEFIPQCIINKYMCISSHVCGINDTFGAEWICR